MKLLLLTIVSGLVGLAAMPEGLLEPVGKAGPTAVLGVALLVLLCWTIPRMAKTHRESLAELSKRHDGWEHERHEDSQKLDATLREMMAHCAGRREENK